MGNLPWEISVLSENSKTPWQDYVSIVTMLVTLNSKYVYSLGKGKSESAHLD